MGQICQIKNNICGPGPENMLTYSDAHIIKVYGGKMCAWCSATKAGIPERWGTVPTGPLGKPPNLSVCWYFDVWVFLKKGNVIGLCFTGFHYEMSSQIIYSLWRAGRHLLCQMYSMLS